MKRALERQMRRLAVLLLLHGRTADWGASSNEQVECLGLLIDDRPVQRGAVPTVAKLDTRVFLAGAGRRDGRRRASPRRLRLRSAA